MKLNNPFYHRADVSDPSMFFDRESSSLSTLNALLSVPKPMNISIIGQRKIGKTAFLKHISNLDVIKKIGLPTQNIEFVYIDLQDNMEALDSKENFYDVMQRSLELSLPCEFNGYLNGLKNSSDERREIVWKKSMKLLADKEIKVIYLFDEFGLAIRMGNLINEGLFKGLRGFYAGSKYFTWVVATHRPLLDLFALSLQKNGIEDDGRYFSNFHDGPCYSIGLFDEKAMRDLIKVPLKATEIEFSSDDVDTIIGIGGRFPYFIQLACYYFYESYKNGNKRVNPKVTIKQILNDTYPVWESFWELLDDRLRKILYSIAGGTYTHASDTELLQLEQQSLIYFDENEQPHPFSEEFGKYVLTKRARYSEMFSIGQWLDDDRYKVISLNEGNPYNVVAQVWDARLQINRAIKFVRPISERTNGIFEPDIELLLREASILFKLSHSNIGKVYDIIKNPPGIIMEWVEGESLEKILKRGKVDTISALEICVQIADALEYLHSLTKPIVHRDIKPSNIIISSNNTAKLIDFGIAHDPDVFTISSEKDGKVSFQPLTLAYCSPEQLIPSNVNQPSDVFSLGVVLYEMLTGERPFQSTNNPNNYPRHHFPRLNRYEIHDSLYKILLEMLKEVPGKRITASQLKRRLEITKQEIITQKSV